MIENQNLFSGMRVRLTAPRYDDATTLARWYENSDFARLFDSSTAIPKSEARVRSMLDDTRSSTEYTFIIRLLENDEMIGYLALDGIQWNNRVAWVGIAIGDPIYRGRGFGTEAMRLMLKIAFHEMNLHRLQLTVFSYNEAAIRLYERVGFVREGKYREALWRDGKHYDMLLYGLLYREWVANQNNRPQ